MNGYNVDQKNDKRKSSTRYDNQFWDRLVRILFITSVVIILLSIAIKWLGFLN
jgi:hypothetical protein